jgi:hypothetical protein
MKKIGAFEAKNTLSALLDLVESGEEIVTTRHGKPVGSPSFLSRPIPIPMRTLGQSSCNLLTASSSLSTTLPIWSWPC